MLRTLAVFGIFGSVALLGAAGCSSSKSNGDNDQGDDGGQGTNSNGDTVSCTTATCPVCTGPAASDAGAAVSFSQDILPIFQNSCGIGADTCHGSYGGGQQSLYLAEPVSAGDGYGDAGAILKGIVGKPSLEAPMLDLVSAGNPEQSYVMKKIDGDMCSAMSDCVQPGASTLTTTITVPCGVPMPETGTPITSQNATLVWQWIAAGAQNN
jgi:hypothetical protein